MATAIENGDLSGLGSRSTGVGKIMIRVILVQVNDCSTVLLQLFPSYNQTFDLETVVAIGELQVTATSIFYSNPVMAFSLP